MLRARRHADNAADDAENARTEHSGDALHDPASSLLCLRAAMSGPLTFFMPWKRTIYPGVSPCRYLFCPYLLFSGHLP